VKLKSIHIWDSMGAPDGGLKGTCKIQGISGDVEVRLGAEACDRIITLMAEGMVEETKRIAEELTVECIEHCGAHHLLALEQHDNAEVIEEAPSDNPTGPKDDSDYDLRF
jgi:hypothetical protein